MRVIEELINEERDVMERVSGLPIDSLAMAVMSNIWRTSQDFRHSMERDILRKYNLTFSSFSTLYIVWVWEPIDMSTIAKSQTVAKSTVSSTVNVLERRGLVQRFSAAEEGDGRSVQVRLTDLGRELIEEVFPQFNAGEKSFVEGLTVSEMETLAGLLRKLIRGRRQDQ